MPHEIAAPIASYSVGHPTDLYQLDRVMEGTEGLHTFIVMFYVVEQGWLQTVFVEHTWAAVRTEVKSYFQFTSSTVLISIFGGVVFDSRQGMPPVGEEQDGQ